MMWNKLSDAVDFSLQDGVAPPPLIDFVILWRLLLLLVAAGGHTSPCSAVERAVLRRVLVFEEEGKFAGWPAGHGAWSWGNELLVGFSVGVHKPQEGHAIDRDQPEDHVLARSLDGGLTWQLERPADQGMLVNINGMRKGITDPQLTESPAALIEQPIDFRHPNFCMTLRLTEINGGSSRLYFSYDRGRSWRGPFQIPMFGQPGVMARTDYLVEGRHTCLVFLTVAKTNHREGRVVATRMSQGGVAWEMLSFVGPEPEGFSIMPSTVPLDSGRFVMATRRREAKRRWIDIWHSGDDGRTWHYRADGVRDVGRGNPPSLIQLADGRLCLTYGIRKPPYDIQARFSEDEGRTWSRPFLIRTGGGGWDIGYPRSMLRPDGNVVTVYYYQPHTSSNHRIEAVIWNPGLH